MQIDERTDGRTDMTQLVIAFCNFENSPKKDSAFNRVCCVVSRCHFFDLHREKDYVGVITATPIFIQLFPEKLKFISFTFV